MAGLETKDLIQQDWIVDRLKELGSSGRSYRKAAELLEATIRLRRAKATQGIEDTAGVIESISSGAFFI
ncbi:hypothetical protein BJY04DRAFT_188598 [Aspergillus karnatakaensis]|uniref:uncharacterized protein n=1 Tax=Aspergillus karnatakaensis TaxID=1810916 RepID=UPI003CCE4404